MIYGIRQFEWDWTNDGTYDYTESPGDGFATHSYSTAGSYTVKLRVYDGDSFCCCSGTGCSDKTATYTITVTVVKVDKIHVMPLPVAEWFDVTGTTIVVLKGATYRFKALPYPAGATWVSGTPVWSGIASGTGETIDVTFNNVGTEFLMAGCRPLIEERRVTIVQVVPEPDEVSFLDYYSGDEHDIYDVSDPVWKRVDNPDNPASYTKNKYIKVGGKFWAPQNLTYSTEVYVDLQDQSTGWPFLSNPITFKNWPSGRSDHRSTNRLADQVDLHVYVFNWRYRVPSGTNQWIDMANISGPHDVYAVYGPPVCGTSYYTKDNLSESVSLATGESTQSGIASKVNDLVYGVIHEGCICEAGFQTNFDAAMGRLPPPPPPPENERGMCCCRAEGLNCVLQVLGIGPYTHDYVNEYDEPNPDGEYDSAFCEICDAVCDRAYWAGKVMLWQGVVKCGGVGSTCYSPNEVGGRDEGTYNEFRSTIQSTYGFHWFYGSGQNDICEHLEE